MIRFSAFAALAFLFAASAQAQAPTAIALDSGPVFGAKTNGVRVFKGIPYAAPPVGDLRWRAPRAPAAWTNALHADDYGPSCPQGATPRFVMPESRGATRNEDCLYLNVWAPVHAQHAPVMVWIHGGGNIDGTSAQTFYDGVAFARDGVVLVSFNYRLGLLGFFAHPELTHAAAPGEATNFGLLDQIAALNWVKRNIAAFGGDPNNVTIFGESAGGQDVLALMTAPAARGLFARVIAESPGGGWEAPPSLADAEAEGGRVATELNAANLAALRAAPADALVRAGQNHEIGPVVDGATLPQAPVAAFAAGRAAAVPLLIGTNSGEGSLLGPAPRPQDVWPHATADALALTRAGYGAEATDDAEFARLLFRDSVFASPSRFIAQHNGAPAYLYRFDYVATRLRAVRPSASHGSEIPFVFQTGSALFNDADGAVAGDLHDCWLAFARTGTPGCARVPAWPALTVRDDRLVVFGATPSVEPVAHATLFDALARRLGPH